MDTERQERASTCCCPPFPLQVAYMQSLTDSCVCRCKGFKSTDQPIAAPAGARFRLLLLALRHCKQCQADATQRGVACPFAATMLLEKVLAIALQYFKAPPAWYGRWTKSEARSVQNTEHITQGHPSGVMAGRTIAAAAC